MNETELNIMENYIESIRTPFEEPEAGIVLSSELGHFCDRYLWYCTHETKGESHIPDWLELRFARGHLHEYQCKEALKEAGFNFQKAKNQYYIENLIRYNPDVIGSWNRNDTQITKEEKGEYDKIKISRISNMLMFYEIKSVDGHAFRSVDTLAKLKYHDFLTFRKWYIQSCIYSYALDIPGKMWITNMDSREEVWLPFDCRISAEDHEQRTVAAFAIDRIRQIKEEPDLNMALQLGHITTCERCDYFYTCLPTFGARTGYIMTGEALPGHIQEALELCSNLKEQSQQYEKSKKLIDEFFKQNFADKKEFAISLENVTVTSKRIDRNSYVIPETKVEASFYFKTKIQRNNIDLSQTWDNEKINGGIE